MTAVFDHHTAPAAPGPGVPYLSSWAGGTAWCVVGTMNQPVSKDVGLKTALEVARGLYGRVTLAVWDGDRGEFTSEMVADPTL